MSSLVKVAMRRAGEGRLDVPVALMMGVAAGAVMFMMPIWRLEQAAAASGLAAVFSPASPPLGMTARALAALVAAGIGFGIAYALMRLVDRASGLFEPAERDPHDEEEQPAPRMRRRDLHPDAPIRRPLSAIRDLGEPEFPAEEPAQPRRRAPLVAAIEAPAMPPMPWEKERPAAEAEPQPRRRKPLFAEPEAEPELVAESQGDEAEVTEACEDTVPVATELLDVAPDEPELGTEEEPSVDEPVSERPAPRAQPAPPAPSRPDGQETIGELLARLERALDRRQPPAPRRQHAPTVAIVAPEAAEPIDTRLRSALENLKRFAPQRG